jgi:hypothetical protein
MEEEDTKMKISQRADRAVQSVLHSRANPLRRDFLVKEKLLHFELTRVLSHRVQSFITSQT